MRKSLFGTEISVKENDLRRSSSDASPSTVASMHISNDDVPKTPFKQRRKSDIHELLPEMLARDDIGSFRVLPIGSSISDFYQLHSPFYEAGGKTVTRCTKIGTDEVFVMKVRVRVPNSDTERSWRSVMSKLLNMEYCPHIVRLEEVLEDDTRFYIVMEECAGGQLFEYLLKESSLSLRVCKRTLREILSATDHLHSAGLIHRDIKPENIVFSNTNYGDEQNGLKLIDFDTCQEFTILSRRRASGVIGTLGYIAPESYNGEYSVCSDLFSVGIIFYIIMTGDMPFDDSIYSLGDSSSDVRQVGSPKAKLIHDRLVHAKVDWDINPWPQIPLAKDLCERLLALDPTERFASASEALDHPWLSSQSAAGSPTKRRSLM